MVMMGALAAASLTCQALIDVVKPNGQKSPVSLMLLTISDSGDRKSTSEAVFTRAIREYEQQKYDEYLEAIGVWNLKVAMWEVQKKELLKVLRKNQRLSLCCVEIEAELFEHESKKPERPRRFRMIYEDSTSQALFLGMYQDGSSVGLVSDEASGMLNGRAFNDFSKLNTLWSGGQITIDRTSSESYQLTDARLTVSMMIQEQAFLSYMSRKGEQARGVGLWARFLVCQPKSIRGTRLMTTFTSSWQRANDFSERVEELLKRNSAFQECQAGREKVKFSPAAAVRWMEVFNEIELGMLKGGRYERMPDFASKLADNMARIAAVIHYFEGMEGEISLDVFEFAIELGFWFSDQFKGVFVPPSQLEVDSIELYEWLLARRAKDGRDTKKNEVLQYGPFRMRKKEVLEPILNMLSEANKIRLDERRLGKVIVRICR
ncbi:hypothetical protein BVH06_10155 [Pseudomonas sp. PA27(2017)]|nr:hypothetical protein BVH06_10155 [Pseudomonas sp. PA27(2017)]